MENVDEKIAFLNNEIRRETLWLRVKKGVVLISIILAVSGLSLAYWSPWQAKAHVQEETRQVAPAQPAPAKQQSPSASEKIYASAFSVKKIRLVDSSKISGFYIEVDLENDAHPGLTAVLTLRNPSFSEYDWSNKARFLSKSKVWFLKKNQKVLDMSSFGNCHVVVYEPRVTEIIAGGKSKLYIFAYCSEIETLVYSNAP
jgi:hypothetical protein